jgi:hypothetical protein
LVVDRKVTSEVCPMSKPNPKIAEQRQNKEAEAFEIIELAINDVEELASAFHLINGAFAHDDMKPGPLVEGDEETLLH